MKSTLLLLAGLITPFIAEMYDNGDIPHFEYQYNSPYGMQSTSSGAPFFADLDGDGDLDASIVIFKKVYIIENTGTPSEPRFGEKIKQPFGLEEKTHTPLFFVDIDNDGDLDAFGITTGLFGSNKTFMQENTGTAEKPEFAEAVEKPFGLNTSSLSTMTFVDIDGDGDLDAFGVRDGGLNVGEVFMCENTGTPEKPEFRSAIYKPFGMNQKTISAPVFTDLLDDGLPDMFGTKRTFTGLGAVYFQKNTGTREKPKFEPIDTKPFGLNTRCNSSPTIADINNDGNIEIFINKLILGLEYSEYRASPIAMYSQYPVMSKPK